MTVRFEDVVDAISQLCKDCMFYNSNSDIQTLCNHPANEPTDILIDTDKVTCHEFASAGEGKSFYFRDLEN